MKSFSSHSAYSLVIIQWFSIGIIFLLAFTVRLFSTIKYESLIHEYDPYFNFRATKFLVENGFHEWWNWFDTSSWYPFGRHVGQTLYPGLMTTAFMIHRILNSIGFVVDIRHVCVFTAPLFSGFCAVATYLLCKESTGKKSPALLASVLVILSPAYMSRSVAGSYDNEAIAIFALVFTFYAYIRALNKATVMSAILACFAYFYMVASWGGYVFITNLISIHIFFLIIMGRIELRHYVIYSVYNIIGTLFCFNIPFVKYQAITSSEHLSSHAIFCLVQIIFGVRAIRVMIPSFHIRRPRMRCLVFSVIITMTIIFLAVALTGKTKWSGRSLTLLDPTYASKFNPIVASVAEHQPPTWNVYLFDLHMTHIFAPVGLWLVFREATDNTFFLGIYGISAVYFSCVMIRLMLVLCPIYCILAGIGLSKIISSVIPTAEELREAFFIKISASDERQTKFDLHFKIFSGFIILVVLYFMLLQYVKHGVYIANVAYSNPSIVLSSYDKEGSRQIEDDFRDSYYWMRHNTHPDSRIMSWWDYGYQSTSMADRTTIVDNNTWNNTHIATVAAIIFGGSLRYSGDDLNKFVWMIRIANGVFPHIQENDYRPVIDNRKSQQSSPAMRNSLLYRFSYYRFSESVTSGIDFLRQEKVSNVLPFKHFEEAFTSRNWLVRIYRVKKPDALKVSLTATGIDRL